MTLASDSRVEVSDSRVEVSVADVEVSVADVETRCSASFAIRSRRASSLPPSSVATACLYETDGRLSKRECCRARKRSHLV